MRKQIWVTEELLEGFERYLRMEERSTNTVKQYMREIRMFWGFLEKENGKEITKEAVLRYKERLREAYHMPSTINTKLCAVNTFLGYLGVPECRVRAVKIQRRMFREAELELSREEYMRLLKEAKRKKKQRLLLLLQTICASGLRISELRFVTMEGVQGNCTEVTAKGKTRRIFLSKKLRKELLRYGKQHGIKKGPIFVSRNGKPLDRSNIWKEMKQLCEGAGVSRRKVFPHNLRHLFARCFYEVKKDLAHLADILGHASVETTRIYTLSSGREHEKIISALGLVI